MYVNWPSCQIDWTRNGFSYLSLQAFDLCGSVVLRLATRRIGIGIHINLEIWCTATILLGEQEGIDCSTSCDEIQVRCRVLFRGFHVSNVVRCADDPEILVAA